MESEETQAANDVGDGFKNDGRWTWSKWSKQKLFLFYMAGGYDDLSVFDKEFCLYQAM